MSALAPKRQHTEESMLALLAKRYRGDGGANGPGWAFIPQVRNNAGFNATRTIDAIAMNLWPSRGLEIHGHEIKVSRADWLREMRDPAKAEAFTQHVDRWWLVVSDASIVQDGELPPTWGLMVAGGRGLVVKVPAPELPPTDAPWMPKGFLAALLRAATRTQEVRPEEITSAVAEARAAWEAAHEQEIASLRASRDELRQKIQEFEREAGIKLAGWGTTPAQVGAAVRLVLSGEATGTEFVRRFERIAKQAEALAVEARNAAGAAA